ncbi:unnamed protein product [Auanema sp. JU1783]|nr:unnamed protein product [Auanema sp. JU1783]
MSEAPDQQVRKILVLPTDSTPRLHETVNDQIKGFLGFLEIRIKDYQDAILQNSAAVFAVNYVQNYFICSQFSVEIARLWEMMNVKTQAEFDKAIEAMKTESEENGALIKQLEETLAVYDDLMYSVDKELDEKLGPCPVTDDDVSDRGVPNQTIGHYCKGSAFELVLIVIVRSFSTPEINQHILALYNKMSELRKMGCDVSLLTKGPPIGGSYIKLIGVPFRRLYDDNDALNEIRAHRKSAVRVAGWKGLAKMMEVSLNEAGRPRTAENKDNNEDETSYVIQMGGTILANREGEVLYKYVEDEKSTWPTVETLISEVKKHSTNGSKSKSVAPSNKVESEISASVEKTPEKEDKKCCTIL